MLCPLLHFSLEGTQTCWSKSNEELETWLRDRNIFCTRRGWKLGWFSLRKRKLRGVISVYKHLMRFQTLHSGVRERAQSSRHKLKYKEVYLSIKAPFFPWKWLSTGIEYSEAQVHIFLSNLLWLNVFWTGGLIQPISRGIFQPQPLDSSRLLSFELLGAQAGIPRFPVPKPGPGFGTGH